MKPSVSVCDEQYDQRCNDMTSRTCPQSRSWRIPVLARGVVFLALLMLMLSTTEAFDQLQRAQRSRMNIHRRIIEDGGLLIDRSPPPIPSPFMLARRQDNSESSSSSSSNVDSSTVTTTPTATSDVNSASDTASATASSPTAAYTASSLPLPFDRNLGSNFTSTACPNFFQDFLSRSTFRQCAPMSLLLQNSYAWIQAVRSDDDEDWLGQTIENSCAAQLTLCTPLMRSIADDLISNQNCGEDFRRQNPLVTQAYAGLMAYEPVYRATCLPDNTTSKYCFVEALKDENNNTNPNALRGSDSYPYYTAIGIALPATAAPACTPCLKETMAIFAGYAQMPNQPLVSTYLSCSRQINSVCGSNFSNSNVQVAASNTSTSAASNTQMSRTLTGVLGAVLLWILVTA